MASSIASENIEAHIQGEISGQVAVGNYNIQIGSVHGGVVNLNPAERQPAVRPRPAPVMLRPRPFRDMLDRETEASTVTADLQSQRPVQLHGQAGLGKTSLLRHLAYHAPTTPFPDGIIYLSARHVPLPDLLQSLFEAFYQSDAPFKPTDAEIRHQLQDKHALIILDDVDLERDEVGALLDAAPACTFLLASTERGLWGEGRALALSGLPLDAALALVERELGRPLTSQERPIAETLCTALEGHPLRLIQAAALAREQDRPLAELAREMGSPSPTQTLLDGQLSSLAEPGRRVLAALAALNGAPLSAEHLAAVTGLKEINPILDTLRQRGLVQAHSPRYSLTGPLTETLQGTWNLTPWMERALAYFTRWAEARRADPERLLPEAEPILQTLEWAFNDGRWRDVLRLGRAIEGALALGRRWGAWRQVLQWMLQAAQALGEGIAEAWALHQLGSRALCLGDTASARTSLIRALRLRESLGDRIGTEVTRHNLNILIGPPPPPQHPPETPPASGPSVGPPGLDIPLLLAGSATFVAAVALVLVLLSAIAGPKPRPTSTMPLAPTSIPPSTPTLTLTAAASETSAPTHTPTIAPTPWNTPTNMPTPTRTPWPCGDPPPHWKLYTVEPGDTLYSLAFDHGTTVELVMCYNRLLTAEIQVGQRMYLPPLPPTYTPTPSNTPSTPSSTPSTPSSTPSTPSSTPATPSSTPLSPTPDITGPTISDITHSPDVVYWPPTYSYCMAPAVINASVTDASGVAEVILTYRVVATDSDGTREGDWVSTPMTQVGQDGYAGTLTHDDLADSLDPPATADPSEYSILEYYIQAFDYSSNGSRSSGGTVEISYCFG